MKSIPDIFDNNDSGDSVILVDLSTKPATEWTVSELRDASTNIAKQLVDKGHQPGEKAAIIAENGAIFAICFFGIMMAGMVAVPINYKLPQASIAALIERLDIRRVFATRKYGNTDKLSAPAAYIDEGFDVEPPVCGVSLPVVDPQQLAMILLTSGSTGIPKAVPLNHAGQLWAIVENTKRNMFIKVKRRFLTAAPMFHMNGLFQLLIAIYNGDKIVLMPKFDANSFFQNASKYECTHIIAVPTMIAMAFMRQENLNRIDLSCVRMVSMGSAPASEALMAKTKAIFPNAIVGVGYGATEVGAAIFGMHPNEIPRPMMSVGYPYPEIDLRLVGPGAPHEGVLHLKTPSMMDRYYDDDVATSAKLCDGWYDTGDIMKVDPNGFYFFVGRADDMIVCGGENIYPSEVEQVLESHPDIEQACVVGASDEIKGTVPIAYVVKAKTKELTAEAVKSFVLKKAAAYVHPRRVHFVDALPMLGPHKIDRTKLSNDAKNRI